MSREINADRKDPDAWSLIYDGDGWSVIAPANDLNAPLGPYFEASHARLADGSRRYPFTSYSSAASAFQKHARRRAR